MIIMVLIMQMLIMIMIMVIMMMIIMIMTKDSDYACFRPFNAAANNSKVFNVTLVVLMSLLIKRLA